ncbi:hypothetical protein [Peribacillus frigoritolerans]|uniref:hypothetical protein n=1 Tax=Peribacillus frigoritolerans TaxID=450367 RepID=UPI002E1D60E7|nr:hypothetical protein [Peribacillus frigoritolerans]MED3845795.1 hypothetical protein [Peribacillus frigoritolerans]
MASKLTKKELLARVEYYKKWEQQIAIPNSIFETLSKDEDLMKKKAPDVAVAYTYLYYITWLYRNAKYGKMSDDATDVSGIKEVIGLSPINKDFNYVIKKGGVLDRLDLTKTLTYKEAPIEVIWGDGLEGFLTWQKREDSKHPKQIEDEKYLGLTVNNKRKQIKYPIFALENEYGEYGMGTFWYWENTHTVPFEVFVECMTNDNLGCTAYYIYAYLYSRCGMNCGSIEVSLEKISAVTGVRDSSRDKALDNLKKFNLIKCFASDYIIGKGDLETPANTYKVISEAHLFNQQPTPYQKRKVMFKEQYEKKMAFLESIDKSYG